MTSGRTTGGWRRCSSGCRRGWRCCARRRRPTIGSWRTWRSSCGWGMRVSSRPTGGRSGGRACGLEVVDLPGRADRLAWLATWLPKLDGSGIVYTLTKRDAELVAEWLTAHGVAAEAYSGEVESDTRVRSRSGCSPTTSRRWWPRARWAWATTSRTSASSSTTRRRARSSPTTSRSGARGARWSTRTWCCCAARRTSASRTSSSSRPSRRARSSSGCSRRWTPRTGRRCRRSSRTSTSAAGGSRRCSRCSTSRVRSSGRHHLETARRLRLDLRGRALRRGHRAQALGADRDGGLRLRRALPHARAAGGTR